MDTYQALLTRRSIFEFTPQPVADALIVKALDAARFAPNHKLTDPWRFIVIGPSTREKIGQINRDLKLAKNAGKLDALPPDQRAIEDAQAERAYRQFVDLPALVAVTQVKSPSDPFRHREDFAATCCAIQNFQLGLWSDGVGCQWSTGAVTTDPRTLALLGVDPASEEMVGFFKIGYPDVTPKPRRKPLEQVLRRVP